MRSLFLTLITLAILWGAYIQSTSQPVEQSNNKNWLEVWQSKEVAEETTKDSYCLYWHWDEGIATTKDICMENNLTPEEHNKVDDYAEANSLRYEDILEDEDGEQYWNTQDEYGTVTKVYISEVISE